METIFPAGSAQQIPPVDLNTTENQNTAQNPTPDDPVITTAELKSPKKENDDDSLTAKRKPTRTSDVWDRI